MEHEHHCSVCGDFWAHVDDQCLDDNEGLTEPIDCPKHIGRGLDH